MPETVNIFRIDPTNVGDFYSSPIHYFDWLSSVRAFDIETTDYDRYAEQLKAANVILGGGGILQFQQMDSLYNAAPQSLIAWGAGHNQKDTEQLIPDSRLKKFSLAGIRDYGTGYEWVPCASCLHPVFDDQPSKPENEVVVYEHKDRPLNIEGLPKMTNREMQLDKVVAFLGSAATVVTNSYHGVYWATLLKRKVVVAGVWSNKFQAFKHPPAFAEIDDWRDHIKDARVYEEALDECREANLRFSGLVRNIIQP
jgi:hypothetical protein